MSVAKRSGPRLTVEASCEGCVHEHNEHYCVEDGNDIDDGYDVYCLHPVAQGGQRRRIGDTTWKTPAWCPLLAEAKAALLAAEAAS